MFKLFGINIILRTFFLNNQSLVYMLQLNTSDSLTAAETFSDYCRQTQCYSSKDGIISQTSIPPNISETIASKTQLIKNYNLLPYGNNDSCTDQHSIRLRAGTLEGLSDSTHVPQFIMLHQQCHQSGFSPLSSKICSTETSGSFSEPSCAPSDTYNTFISEKIQEVNLEGRSPYEIDFETQKILLCGAERYFSTPFEKYPIIWQGHLALKSDEVAVKFHFIFGNLNIAKASLPEQKSGSVAFLRIAQRMRLEPTQIEGVRKKIQVTII